MDSDSGEGDLPCKAFTHILFSANGINYATPINDLHIAVDIRSRIITIRNLATDQTFTTDKIRTSSPLEMVRFVNGKYNPFNNYT